MGVVRLLLPIAALLIAAQVLAQRPTAFIVEREDATLVVTNYGLSEDGARSILGTTNCEDGVRLTVMYGPPNEIEMVIDGETVLRSSLIIIREPRSEDGEGESGDQQTIEMLDGEALFTDRPACLEEFIPAEEPLVVLEQGRTTVNASRFFLDRESDVANMDGPIDLVRAPEGEAEPLEARAQELTYDLETEHSILTGDVQVVAGERTSEAQTLELDEEAGLATLTGNPARSREGDDTIAGNTLLYYLDSNDVVVVGGVQGTLEVDLD